LKKTSFLHHDLEYFLKIAENKTLLQSAETLGISQPALSRSLTRLENQLGFKVLQRSRSGIRLTEQGQHLFQRLLQSQMEMNEMIEGVRSGETDFYGQVKIGAHSSLLLDYLMPIYPELLKEFPKINFQLEAKSSIDVIQDLVAEKLDLGLVINPADYSTLILKNTGSTQALFYSDVKEPTRFFMNPQMVDLAKIMKLLRREGFDERHIYYISDYELIAKAIQEKLGCGLLPKHVAERFALKTYVSFLNSYKHQFHLFLAINSNHQNDKMKTILRFLESRLK
jgi:DNA-binding transcriptional LysR family regulator